jgi:hypothetical protein
MKGGVLRRAGHTEASLDFARLAGRYASAYSLKYSATKTTAWPGCPNSGASPTGTA